MKFQCSICKSEVTNISVCKRYVLRDDYMQVKNGMPLLRDDREYLDGEVLNIVYQCKCGRINERLVRDVPHLDDFWVDLDAICGEYLTQEKYGTLLVMKE